MPSDWVERQLRERGIRDARVLAAMRAVPRELFVPEHARRHAYDDAALPLGHGQTISQPYVVALICQALALEGDELVLDVGTGSGYQAAVLDELAPQVVSVERIPELAEVARRNLADAATVTSRCSSATARSALPSARRSTAIAVAAAAAELPAALVDQLAPGGRLVLPLGGYLVRVTKTEGRRRVEPLAPVRFVPLVTGFPP